MFYNNPNGPAEPWTLWQRMREQQEQEQLLLLQQQLQQQQRDPHRFQSQPVPPQGFGQQGFGQMPRTFGLPDPIATAPQSPGYQPQGPGFPIQPGRQPNQRPRLPQGTVPGHPPNVPEMDDVDFMREAKQSRIPTSLHDLPDDIADLPSMSYQQVIDLDPDIYNALFQDKRPDLIPAFIDIMKLERRKKLGETRGVIEDSGPMSPQFELTADNGRDFGFQQAPSSNSDVVASKGRGNKRMKFGNFQKSVTGSKMVYEPLTGLEPGIWRVTLNITRLLGPSFSVRVRAVYFNEDGIGDDKKAVVQDKSMMRFVTRKPSSGGNPQIGLQGVNGAVTAFVGWTARKLDAKT